MKVTIFGPNLTDQSKGQFHVHAADCGDCAKYGPHSRYGGEYGGGLTIEADSQFDVSAWMYEDHLSDFGLTDPACQEAVDYFNANLDEFHFAPCVQLPRTSHLVQKPKVCFNEGMDTNTTPQEDTMTTADDTTRVSRKPIKLVAVDPDGGRHYRRTPRTYTHAILVYFVPADQDADYLTRQLAYYETWEDSTHKTKQIADAKAKLEVATGERIWSDFTWCGRPDLAIKAAAKVQKNRKPGDRVEIVEVEVALTAPRKKTTPVDEVDELVAMNDAQIDPESFGDEPEVTNDEENMGLIAAQAEPLPQVEVGTEIDPAAIFLLGFTYPNLFEQQGNSPSKFRCKLCNMENVPVNHREAHYTAHKADSSINAQKWADRRATMAIKTPKISKKTARDQGVPEVYLSESGSFKPGLDARYKSDLIASILGETNPAALETFAPGDAHKRMETRGWLNFLAKAQKSREAKIAKAELKASKAKTAAVKKSAGRKPAAKKTTIAKKVEAAKPDEAVTQPAAVEVTPDPKPTRKPRSDKGMPRHKLTPSAS